MSGRNHEPPSLSLCRACLFRPGPAVLLDGNPDRRTMRPERGGAGSGEREKNGGREYEFSSAAEGGLRWKLKEMKVCV